METRLLPEVSTVVPDYKNKAFTVYFKDDNDPLSLNFQNYMLWIMLKDVQLTDYIVKNHNKNSFSDMIQDLYEIGYPVESKIMEFFDEVETKLDPALLRFLHFLRNGFEGTPQDDDLTD